MERRDFIRKGLGAGIMAGAALSLGNMKELVAAGIVAPALPYDLVAVAGGEPEVMFDKAIASLGGMKAFVKKGQKVVVKPNIGWDVVPEKAACTNPKLVGRIVRHCLEAGAKEVYVFDNTCDEWASCYRNSGIEKAVKDAGGRMVPGNSERYYQSVSVPRGKNLKKDKVHELILDSDVFINVPVLKNHSGSGLTMAMKNLMGVNWDRRFWHRNDLHQCIADFSTYCKPHLNILDAYRVMRSNGPRGVSIDDVVLKKSLLVSTDIVAIDAAGAKLFGTEPADIRFIKIADQLKVGTMKLDQLNINRIKLA